MQECEKTPSYGLEHAARDLHSILGPILMNTDRLLARYAGKRL